MSARGRFAPSPTGSVHLGTARTALLAWLSVRVKGGAFVMRFEDLDAPRVRAGALEAIEDDLRCLGLDWDEGRDVGGPYGPYVQSERTRWYQEAFERLRDAGHLYPCTCSRKEISEIASAPHGAEPVYPGTCKDRPSHPERTPSWRFRMPDIRTFEDRYLGPVILPNAAGDFVVRRADGVFSYQLACVVDDRAMCIDEVVRGEDLVSSTPRQIALHRALSSSISPDLAIPTFSHVPLMRGRDGERLSKRHGDIGIAALRSSGQSAAEIVAMLARSVGLTDAESTTPSELLAEPAVRARFAAR